MHEEFKAQQKQVSFPNTNLSFFAKSLKILDTVYTSSPNNGSLIKFLSSFRHLVAFDYINRGIENLGMAMVNGLAYFAQGRIPEENYLGLIQHEAVSSFYFNRSIYILPQVKSNILKIFFSFWWHLVAYIFMLLYV